MHISVRKRCIYSKQLNSESNLLYYFHCESNPHVLLNSYGQLFPMFLFLIPIIEHSCSLCRSFFKYWILNIIFQGQSIPVSSVTKAQFIFNAMHVVEWCRLDQILLYPNTVILWFFLFVASIVHMVTGWWKFFGFLLSAWWNVNP